MLNPSRHIYCPKGQLPGKLSVTITLGVLPRPRGAVTERDAWPQLALRVSILELWATQTTQSLEVVWKVGKGPDKQLQAGLDSQLLQGTKCAHKKASSLLLCMPAQVLCRPALCTFAEILSSQLPRALASIN